MYIIVAGGGQVGYYLTRELIAQEHEVLVLEKDSRRVDLISSELGNVVFKGDACEASTLTEVGTGRADVVCAVTGDDEDNLVICQVAKKRFNVPRTIARINNPKNEEIFRRLGIEMTVSTTEVILSILEQEIPSDNIVPLLRLRHADIELVEATLPAGSPILGQALRSLSLPSESTIALVIRGGKPLFPDGGTVLESGDEVIAFTRSTHESELRDLFFSRAGKR
jgi:trk system potassium uptake protein TrkA